MYRMRRCPSHGEEALYEYVEEFARVYTPSTDPLPKSPYYTLPEYRWPNKDPQRPRPGYDDDNEVEFDPDPYPTGNSPTTPAAPSTDPDSTGSSSSTLVPATDTQPKASPPSTESTIMAN
jgi:hypothetical protein